MKNLLLPLALTCLSLVALTGCATYTANLSTTSGSEASTVDNPGSIAAGASVTATSVASNTTVSAISGDVVTLSAPATTTGTASATFKNTVAVQFATNEKAYEQTIGSALQTAIPLIKQGASAASALSQVATAWGLEPSNPTQRTAFTNIQSDLTKASSSATLLQTFVTGLQTAGSTP